MSEEKKKKKVKMVVSVCGDCSAFFTTPKGTWQICPYCGGEGS